jgi:hypothetical protein
MGVGKFWVGDSVGEGTEEEGDEMEDTRPLSATTRSSASVPLVNIYSMSSS